MKIAGWASWFDEPDNGEDIVRKGAFLRSLEQRPRVGMLFAHDPNRPVGRWDLIEEREGGLWVEGEVIDEQAVNFVATGMMFGLSIGYKGRRTLEREDGFRELLDVELIEVSITATPMNHRCLLSVVPEQEGTFYGIPLSKIDAVRDAAQQDDRALALAIKRACR